MTKDTIFKKDDFAVFNFESFPAMLVAMGSGVKEKTKLKIKNVSSVTDEGGDPNRTLHSQFVTVELPNGSELKVTGAHLKKVPKPRKKLL